MQRVYNRFKDDKLTEFIEDIKASLSDDGILYLFVLKHDEVWDWVQKNGDSLRHLAFGPKWKDYTNWIRVIKDPKEVIDLFFQHGLNYVGEFKNIENINSPVPAWGLKFRKFMEYKPAWEYMQDLYKVPEGNLNIADLGPGNFPFPKANLFIEHPSRKNDKRYDMSFIEGKNVVYGDIQDGIPSIKDKEIDYIWVSHILEHVDNPKAAVKEICRIAKSGTIVIPSPYKDTLMFWDEEEHKWDIYKKHGKLIFVRRDPDQISKIRNKDIKNYFFDIFRGKQYTTNFEKCVKQWFETEEKWLDIVLEWNGSFEVEVIE